MPSHTRLRCTSFFTIVAVCLLMVFLHGCSKSSSSNACIPHTEVCDGKDNDCDGIIDNGFNVGATCSVGVGACQASGVMACSPDGAGTVCTAVPGQPTAEVCDGLDNDCDGVIDEEIAGCCTSGDSRTCGIDQGVCKAGTQTCTGRAWGACLDGLGQPVVLPGDLIEVCNSLDDDCDAVADAQDAGGCSNYYADQDGDGFGAGPPKCLCAPAGLYTATQGGDCNDLYPSVHPGRAEICDGIDQNCNGETDEGVPGCCAPGATVACGINQGACQAGTQTCTPARVWGSCLDSGGQPVVLPGQLAEACNGVDDNCDGNIDEGIGLGPSCTAGVGACQRTGHLVCVSNQLECDAQPGQPGVEVCDGLDNDCDGNTDEGLVDCCAVANVRACGSNQGVCIAGTQTCTAAFAWGPCLDSGGQPVVLPGQNTELCNGKDDDCDGQIDEAGATGCTIYYLDQDNDGYGVTGQSRCLCVPVSPYTAIQAGDCDDTRSSVHPGAAEVCNNVDDNCDSMVDEPGPDGYMANDKPSCEKQLGVCAGARKTASLCVGGAWRACNDAVYLANSANYQANELACDGLDNDCDGSIDESFSVTLLDGRTVTGAGKACGVGQCAGGFTVCKSDKSGIICNSEANASNEICGNSRDDNCNGVVDDGC